MKIYIVPTPIGNLRDITLRAIDVLNEVGLILAEDTRKTKILLNHLGIDKKIDSFHKFNEHQKIDYIVSLLKSGLKIALVSDAGTPGISDPGFLIVRSALQAGIEVETLPGPTALIPALINSGLPCDKFVFEGFLPQKKGRQKNLQRLQNETRTMVFYESPHRLHKTIDEFIENFGSERQACICRELTKIYEENIRGSLAQIKHKIDGKTIKGEIVIVVEGCK